MPLLLPCFLHLECGTPAVALPARRSPAPYSRRMSPPQPPCAFDSRCRPHKTRCYTPSIAPPTGNSPPRYKSMFHRSCRDAIFALLTILIAASAQQPAPNNPSSPPQAIPDTPAGHAFKAWFDSFNSGGRAAIDAYVHKYEEIRRPRNAVPPFQDGTVELRIVRIVIVFTGR